MNPLHFTKAETSFLPQNYITFMYKCVYMLSERMILFWENIIIS